MAAKDLMQPKQVGISDSNSGAQTAFGDERPQVQSASHSLWARFALANKRYCRSKLQPRLYPVSHMAALEYWFQRRIAEMPPAGALLEFGCGRTFRLTHLL